MPRLICDFHIHSRFARGCSKDITIPLLEKWAKIKGIDVLGTGDAVHPEWLAELKRELVKESKGIYFTATGQAFVLQTELSLVYTEGRGRRIHLVVLAPSFAIVDRIAAYLRTKGRIDADGRPILGIACRTLVRDLKSMSEEIEIIPAHAWTPWFSLFGSKSGYDSLQECFGDQTRHIHAIETGLSSDIEMNDRLLQLKGVRFVSFSDAHSYWPWRLGREATILEPEELTYAGLIEAIRTGKRFWGTIEVPPEYGKYHIDGHRACGVAQDPETTRRNGELCPVCGKPLTIGVQYRVDELADLPVRTQGHSQRFYKLLPLHEIIALVTGKGLATKGTWKEYWNILKSGANEYDILINATEAQLEDLTSVEIARAIIAVREGRYSMTPGFDGVYGVPRFDGVTTHALSGDDEAPKKRASASKDSPRAANAKRAPKQKAQRDLAGFFSS